MEFRSAIRLQRDAQNREPTDEGDLDTRDLEGTLETALSAV